MTRDDIIRLARQAGLHYFYDSEGHCGGITTDKIEGDENDVKLVAMLAPFAALVAAPLEEEIKRLRFCIPEGDAAAAMEYLAHCVDKAVAAEREACAKVCEDIPLPKNPPTLTHLPTIERCAAAIRARGDK